MFYSPILEDENRNLSQALQPVVVVYFDVFTVTHSNFEEWLHVWRMDLSDRNANNNDLFAFARASKASFTDLIENEIEK